MGVSTLAAAQASYEPYGGGTRITGPAQAQIPTGPVPPEIKGRIATQQLARCLIKLHRSSVLKAIQPEPWADGADKMLRSVVDDRCLDEGALSIPTNLMRGAFYQYLYRETYAAAPLSLPAAATDFGASNIAGLKDDAKVEVAVRQFGDCVARLDSTDAHAFVVATPGSKEEDAALNALAPHLGACLMQGSKWTLNRSSLGAVLSEVLYRERAASPSAEK